MMHVSAPHADGAATRRSTSPLPTSSLRAAAQAYDTPVYVTDLVELARSAAELEHAFGGGWIRQYSLKANDLPELVTHLGDRGWGANVVSSGEWRLARRAGIPNSRISIEGIGKTDEQLCEVVRAHADNDPLRWLSIESADELHALSRIARAQERWRRHETPVRLLLRLNPDVDPETHHGLAVGRLTSKFGIGLDELDDLLADDALSDAGIALRGFHVHVGSQLNGVQAWLGGARAALSALQRARVSLPTAQLDTIDFGGGFPAGIPGAPRPLNFRRALDELVQETGLAMPDHAAIEPGRSVVATAGWLVARVLHVRHRGGLPQVVIDTGMTELIRPALYGSSHAVHALDQHGPLTLTAVEGPVCESADTFGHHDLPALQRGDLVAIEHTGAYASSLATQYNGRPRPAEVFIGQGGEVRLAQARDEVR
jgi:diaminopimelate decarboxylase